MSKHIKSKTIVVDSAKKVLSVEQFASEWRLDEKQKRDLLKLLGQFATRQELLWNTRLPLTTR